MRYRSVSVPADLDAFEELIETNGIVVAGVAQVDDVVAVTYAPLGQTDEQLSEEIVSPRSTVARTSSSMRRSTV